MNRANRILTVGLFIGVVSACGCGGASDPPPPISVPPGQSSCRQNIINTIAGGGRFAGPALSVAVPGPENVVKDKRGNLYILSLAAQDVFKVDALGNLTVYAGVGYGGYSGDGGPANKATLESSTGLALDGRGNLFISDSYNNVIRRVDAISGIITTVAGNGYGAGTGGGGYSGDDGPATSAELNIPLAVVVDGLGDLFIADSGNFRIRRVDATTGTITTLAGNGTPCSSSTSACGDGGPAIDANFSFLTLGLAVDRQGDVFIADDGDFRIRKVQAGTGILSTVAGNGTPGFSGDGGPATSAGMNPWGIALDSAGDLFIADQINARVRKVSAKTQIITTVAGNGTPGFSGDGGAATSAELNFPQGIILDSENNLYIPDAQNNRVRMVAQKTQVITTVAGGGPVGDGGPAKNAILASPSLVNLDADGNYFISDQVNNRIRRVDARTGLITTVAGNGIAGYSGDGGPATSASISTPVWGGVAVDSEENLFIGDTYNYVVRRVDGVSGIITTFAGNGNFCSPSTAPCGDGGPATGASFGTIGGVALDSMGDLFISDFSTQRIRRVDANTGVVTTVAGNGNICTASTDPCGDGGAASLATFNAPWGIAFDVSNNLYIVDVGDNRIRSVNAGTQIINTVAFNGNPAFGGDGGPALNASMQNPYEVAVDSSGNIFVSGGFDEVVRRIDAATGTIVTVAGNASNPVYFGFSGDGGPATSATLADFGLAIGNSGNLLIADGVNGRIRHVDLVPTVLLSVSSLTFPAQMVGTSSPPETVTLTNTGSATLGITSIGITGTDAGDYSQTNTCGSGVAPSLSCTVNVTFSPKAKRMRTATLTFTDNAPNCGAAGSQTVALSGTGK